MRVHYVLNHGDTPMSKLADVEIHFEEGLLAGLKLVGCSIWKSKKGESPTVLVPSRSYATAGGVRYYELIRPSAGEAEGDAGGDPSGKDAVRRFKQYVREEYLKIAGVTAEEGQPSSGKKGRKGGGG
jgi:hypothetical protein